MKFFSLIFVLIIVLISCHRNHTNGFFKEALKNDSLKNYDKSIELYSSILKLDSNNYAALVNRGRARINKGDRAGLNDLEMAADRFPNSDTYINLAAAYMYLKIKTDLVFDKLQKAKTYDPNNRKVYLAYMGYYDRIQCNNDSIIKYANKVIIMDKKYSPIYRILENIFSKQKNYGALKSICDSIIKYEPNAFTYNNRGFARFKMGDINSALQDIDNSITLDSKNSFAYKNKAIIELQQNDKMNACKNLKKAQELGYLEKYGREVDSLLLTNCEK